MVYKLPYKYCTTRLWIWTWICNLWCSSEFSTGTIIISYLCKFIYVNDIQYAITNAKIKLFADDINLFFRSKDLIKLFTLANAGMLHLSHWFKVNKLSLNVDKTCYSVYGPNCKKDTALILHINGKVIQNVNCCKYLGIMIDSDMKWKKTYWLCLY